MEIGEPSVLTNTAQPLFDTGRIFSTAVYGITDGVKRKRQEVCTGVDGDSISIHEVRHGRNLSSCPLPPDSTLCCPPCSLHIKSDGGKRSRNTYYLSNRRNEISLSLYTEVSNDAVRKSASRTLLLQKGTVPVQIEVLAEFDKQHILVARENGQFEIYDEDISARQRHGRLTGLAEGARLVAVQWLSLRQAARTVLKARPDITATSDSSCSFILGASVLQSDQASGTGQNVEFTVWRLSKPQGDSYHEMSPKALVHHILPITSPLVSQEMIPISFTSRETRLIVRSQSKVYVIDLTSTTFQQIQEISPVASDHHSSFPISDQLTLVSTSTSLQLYNTQFRTLQAKVDLNKPGLKRKRSQSSAGPIFLSNYFPVLNRVVAIRRGQLIAIDLRISGYNEFSTAVKQSSLLINNIGRGTMSQERLKLSDRSGDNSASRKSKQNEALEQWHAKVKQLDQYLQEKDFANFDKAFLEQLPNNGGKAVNESYVLTNYKVDYVISKLIEYKSAPSDTQSANSPSLQLAFPAPRILETLATKGFLTIERINKVLRASARSTFEPVGHGNISQMIMDCDSSLNLLDKYLRLAPYIAEQELCFACLKLLRHALIASQKSSSLAVGDSRTVTSTALVAATTGTPLNSIKEHQLARVTSCLCIVLKRLAERTQNMFSKFMRDSFAQEEIIALVQILRQQLFRGGYIGSLEAQLYPSPPESENGFTTDGEAPRPKKTEITLEAIASILCSCVDAIGPIGVLSFGDEDTFFQKLIPELSSEISRATEAVQDAISLEGMIREFLRFVESVPRNLNQDDVVESGAVAHQTRPGAIITLYSESYVHGGLDQNVELLPLGLRAENKINTTKTRKGNGLVSRRSQREMAMHQDRLRGAYALERLVL